MTAKGFSSRRLRSRSRQTASELVASHARWNPPSPLTATIFPSRRAAAAKATAPADPLSSLTVQPSASPTRSLGPHSGHALGWAWKRRSAGSQYSREHRRHMVNPAIVVRARS